MIVQILSLFAIICIALVVGKIVSKVKLPAILGWLITGVVFWGIALATAPAPALSIVNEYRTKGPVTKTLIPLAAIDDVIGVVVFFTVISIIGSVMGGRGTIAGCYHCLRMPSFCDWDRCRRNRRVYYQKYRK